MHRQRLKARYGSIGDSARYERMHRVFLGLILLVETAAAPPADTSVATPITPQQFFQGRTESRGELRQLFSKPHAVVSHGNGHLERDGTLILNQTVHETNTAPRRREWRLRQDRAGHCTGTVTDGVGLVDGKLIGNQLHMRFRLKGGLNVEQWLSFHPDGRSASNRMKIRKFGFSVASLSETIRKTD
jgi:hypothetical protein